MVQGAGYRLSLQLLYTPYLQFPYEHLALTWAVLQRFSVTVDIQYRASFRCTASLFFRGRFKVPSSV